MVDQPEAASSPDQGQAGSTGKGLASAVDAAINDAIQDDTKFSPAATPAEPKPKTTKVDQATSQEPAAEGEDTGKPAEGAKPKAAEAPDDLKLPGQWDAATREAVAKLPPDAQKLVVRLAKESEAVLTKKTMEAADERKFAQAVKGLITPEHKAQLQRAGLNEVDGFKRLLSYQDKALKDPEGYLVWFASQAKVDIPRLVSRLTGAKPNGQQPPAQAEQPQQPPRRDPNDPLLEKLSYLESWVQDQEGRQAVGHVQRFKDAKDASGNPLRPHYAQVEKVIAHMLMTDPVLDEMKIDDPEGAMQRAYDAAVALDPDLRSQFLEAEVQKRSSATRKADDLAKAQRARPAIAAPAQVSGGGSSKGLPIEDHVTRAMEKLGL